MSTEHNVYWQVLEDRTVLNDYGIDHSDNLLNTEGTVSYNSVPIVRETVQMTEIWQQDALLGRQPTVKVFQVLHETIQMIEIWQWEALLGIQFWFYLSSSESVSLTSYKLIVKFKQSW